MIIQNNLSPFTSLAIGHNTQTLNNRLFDRYGKITAIQRMKSILLACYEDLSYISIQFKSAISVDTNMDTNSKVRTRYAPKTYFFMFPKKRFPLRFPAICHFLRTYRIFRHVKQGFLGVITRGQKNHFDDFWTNTRACARGKSYFLDLFSFSRQVAITQAEKFVFSFLACSSICSMSSWGNRIFFNCDLLFLLPVTIIQSLMFKLSGLINSNKKWLTCLHTKLYIGIYTPNEYFRLYKTIAQRVRTSMSYLTKPLNEVMIMANRYDSATLRAEQSKLFKFFDRSTAQVVQSIAISERQARKNLGKQSLIFIARTPLNPTFERSTNWGGYSHV